MEAPNGTPKQQVFETTWLEGVVEMEARHTGDGGVILTYTLGNGHRYALPLKGQLLDLTRRAVSPVALPGDVPSNGHGAVHLS